MNIINMLGIQWVDDALLKLLNVIMRLLYGAYFAIVKAIAWVLDMLTQLFFIFAGMTPVSSTNIDVETGEAESIDIVNFFLTQTSFQKAYFYLCLVALGLIVVFAIGKVIKQDYFDRNGPRSKGPIFRNIALSFIAFICIIPIFYFLIDIAAALALMVMRAMGYKGGGIGSMLFNICWDDNGESIRMVAESLPGSKIYDPDNFGWFSNDTFYQYYWDPVVGEKRVHLAEAGSGVIEGEVGNAAAVGVQEFYWYIFIFAGFILIVNLGDMMISMVSRMYKLIALFIVAPSPISQIVLDDGDKFKKWKDQVIQEAVRVIGCVMCFMIYIMIAGVVNELDLMRYAFTEDSASAISLIEGNALTSELSNSITPLYYYGSKISWVDKAINALGKAMILVAGVGAIRDIDTVITPFLYGGKASMDDPKSATRNAIIGAGGAAAKGALALGKTAVGAAVNLANAGVGMIGKVGNSLAHGTSRGVSVSRTIASAGSGGGAGGSGGGGEAGAPDTAGTPPSGGGEAGVPDTAGTPPSGGGEAGAPDTAGTPPSGGGEAGAPDTAGTPPSGGGEAGPAEEGEYIGADPATGEESPATPDMLPTMDDDSLDDIELSGGAKFAKGALGAVGGIISGAGSVAFGIAGAALSTTGKVAKTALGAGLSTAKIAARTVADMTGMGKAYSAVEGAVGDMASNVKKFAVGEDGKGGVVGKVKDGAKKVKDKIAKTGTMKAISKWHEEGGITNSVLGSLSTAISGADKMRTADRRARSAISEHGDRVADGFDVVSREDASDSDVLTAAREMVTAGEHHIADAEALRTREVDITGLTSDEMRVDEGDLARILEDYARADSMTPADYAALDAVESEFGNAEVVGLRKAAIDSYVDGPRPPTPDTFSGGIRRGKALNAIRRRIEALASDDRYKDAINAFETSRSTGARMEASALGRYKEYLKEAAELDNAYLYVDGGFGGDGGVGQDCFNRIKGDLERDANYKREPFVKHIVEAGIKARAASTTVIADMARASRPGAAMAGASAATRAQASFERMRDATTSYENAVTSEDAETIADTRAKLQTAASEFKNNSAALQTHMGASYERTRKVSDENRELNRGYSEDYDADRAKIAKNIGDMKKYGASEKSIAKAEAKLAKYDSARQEAYANRKRINGGTYYGSVATNISTGVRAKAAKFAGGRRPAASSRREED